MLRNIKQLLITRNSNIQLKLEMNLMELFCHKGSKVLLKALSPQNPSIEAERFILFRLSFYMCHK